MSSQPHDRPATASPQTATEGEAVEPAEPVWDEGPLSRLARLAMAVAGTASTETIEQACGLIQTALGADEAYVVQGGDPYFVRVGEPGDPTAYELKQKGYFLVWQQLAANPQLTGGLLSVADRRVFDPAALRPGVPSTHLALLLPSDESISELLIVRGPWPSGLTRDQVEFITAARPMLAYLAATLLDTQRRQRQRQHLQSLGSVAAALKRSQELETALPAIATALAKASGFAWVTLTLVDERMERVTVRVLNHTRHSDTETAETARSSSLLLRWAVANARRFAADPRPILYPDLFDSEHDEPMSEEMRHHFERSHLLSLGILPLQSGERVLGSVTFSSSTPRGFEAAEVEFLTLLSEQAVLAIEWLQLHGELRKANEALAHAASHDTLTGLPNRALFLDRFTQALARSQRSNSTVAALFLDLDNFKVVNDSLGHELGDRLLQAVAERLQRHVRAGDTAARFGGDEFMVLLEDVIDEAEAARVAERLLLAVQQPVELDGHQLVPNASIGIACSSTHNLNAAGLVRKADMAMYQAKAQGKGRYTCYQESMNDTAVQRLALETEVRLALIEGQFRVHYQPIVALASARLVEVEALARWEHPERGLLAPAHFIPVAEETGLIVPLGLWMLQEACRQAATWRARRPDRRVVMSVNLSARQFQQPTLVEDVAAILAETGLPPANLKLEITESTVMADAAGAAETLQRLKRMGVQLAIDDFGTGYSSLSYLKHFPVDTLKIDRSFVDGLTNDPHDAAIVRSVVAIAKSMNLSVTAEGIETAEQLACLIELGCEHGQGYLFARPLAPADQKLVELLRASQPPLRIVKQAVA